MKEFITKSAAETSKVAALLGTKILSGAVIAFTGDLGAGKTTFIKGLAKSYNFKNRLRKNYVYKRTCKDARLCGRGFEPYLCDSSRIYRRKVAALPF